MSLELIKFAFVAGELSPTFLGRSDLEKFDLGLAEAVNWFVDYRGGLSTRQGLDFGDFIKRDDLAVKMFEFKYAPNVANTYVLLFGHNYIRFIQDNAYILEANKTIVSVTKANPGVVTVTSHGFSNGDWVKFGNIVGMSELSGRTVLIAGVTTHTFQIQDVYATNINTTAYGTFTSGTLARVYTLVSPYASTDLSGLSITQFRDTVRITSNNFPVKNLVRSAATSWAISDESFASPITVPTGVATAPQGAGTYAVGFCVTAVNEEGNESLPSTIVFETGVVDYTTTAGGVTVTWTPVIGAKYYNIYRTIIVANTIYSRAAEVGFLGRAYGGQFNDNNIIPDFTHTPPQHYNPFANSVVEQVDVTAPGAGYTQASTVTIAGAPGTGFVGYPLVNYAGLLIGVRITNGGAEYIAPTATFSIGAGGAATVTVGPATGNYPALSARFQQRQIYAASRNKPLTVWGSQPGRLSNFDFSQIVLSNDSFEFELDADEVTPIKHMLSMRGGLMLMTDGGVWLLTGGGDNQPVTPTQVLAQPHTFVGVSDVPPIKIDTNLLYVESKGFTVRLLAYNDFSRLYSGEDISILSNHLFATDNYITRWAFASDPHKLVYGRRLDGALLLFTMVKEQNVFAWTRAYTEGFFEDVLSIQRENTDDVYVIVKRLVNGRYCKYFERFARRNVPHVEDSHCVDSGLALGATYPNARIHPEGLTGTITVLGLSPIFSAGDVGKVLRVGGGKGTVTAFTDSTHITVALTRDITLVIPERDDQYAQFADPGEWTLDTPVSTVGGLWHLENLIVSILNDGNVEADRQVIDGRITLDNAGTRVSVGLGFTCVAKTLPLSIAQATVENRRKRLMGFGVRLNESRGLKIGTRRDKLYSFKERTSEAYAEPTNLQTGMKNVLVQPRWDNDGPGYFVQTYPLPATILGFVASTEIGDDPD